jgi:beta-glucosidase
MMSQKAGTIWGGYLTPYDKFVFGVEVGQKYLMENTTLGIPAIVQSEGTLLHSVFLAACMEINV